MLMHSLVLTAVLFSCSAASASESRILEKKIVVRASLNNVWNAWTTEEGLSFASRDSNVELRIGGPYEWFLDGEPDERGLRGGEGSRVLAFLPRKMIAFSWTFPPDIPTLRDAGETTQVVVLFEDKGDGMVGVSLYAHGWQEGENWQLGWEYFDNAWGFVLEALKQHFGG